MLMMLGRNESNGIGGDVGCHGRRCLFFIFYFFLRENLNCVYIQKQGSAVCNVRFKVTFYIHVLPSPIPERNRKVERK